MSDRSSTCPGPVQIDLPKPAYNSHGDGFASKDNTAPKSPNKAPYMVDCLSVIRLLR